MMNTIIPLLCLVACFVVGVIMGISGVKKDFGIPHGVDPYDCEVIVHGRDDFDD